MRIPRKIIIPRITKPLAECYICLEKFNLNETGACKLPCNHLYHTKCVLPWLKKNPTCPYCRGILPKGKNVRQGDLETVLFSWRATAPSKWPELDVSTMRARMRSEMNALNHQLNTREGSTQSEHRHEDFESQISSMSASENTNNSQVEEATVDRPQRQTSGVRSSSTRRYRMAAMRARSAIADIYRRQVTLQMEM